MRDLVPEDFAVLTQADVDMIEMAMTAGADEVDYSLFYDEDDE